jgi:amino acid transporter, AAT family
MTESLKNGGKFNYIHGLINLAVIFCIVWLLWYVFMHADGVMKLYTPMYGFSLVAMLLASVILLSKVLGWPADPEKPLTSGAAIAKGILGTVIVLAIMYFVYYVVFWRFIGALGVAYFSPSALVAGGGTGAEPWNAREWASTAILYFSTAFLWWALVWNLGFGRWPWQNDGRWVVAFSKMFVISFFAIITFAVMFHPHICVLFPEAQKMAGAQSWWESWAETTSAFWGLGLLLCTLFWVVYSDLFWEGQPFKLLERDGEGNLVKGIVTFLVTLALGLLLMYFLTQVFNLIWEEPYQGGQYTDGPDWRFIHMGELSGFCVLFAFIWKNYFNNFPNGLPLILRASIRSLIGVGGGLLIYWFYYSPLSNFFLGKLEGWGQAADQPLVWTLLFLAVVLIQAEFFHNWPLRIARRGK